MSSLRLLTASAADSVPRSIVIDVARGMAMIAVLYGHALEVFFDQRPDGRVFDEAFFQYKASAGFAMAVFFMVSGAAGASLANKTWRSVLRTSLYLIALAYLVHFTGLFLRLTEIAATGDGKFGEELLTGLETALKGRGFSTVVVWFLVSLAAVRLIVWALFKTLSARMAYLAVVAIGLSSFLVPYIPNAFMAKTWSIGVVFFALGMAIAPHVERLARPSSLPLLLLLPVSLWLALQNRGCPYDLWATCPLPELGDETVVWVHVGEIGFIPLYWAVALTGSIGVFALAGVLVRSGLAGFLARVGSHTMGILIINGFVLVFLQRWLKEIPIDNLPMAAFPAILVGVVLLHLVALQLLHQPLRGLSVSAGKLADIALGEGDRIWSGFRGGKPVGVDVRSPLVDTERTREGRR